MLSGVLAFACERNIGPVFGLPDFSRCMSKIFRKAAIIGTSAFEALVFGFEMCPSQMERVTLSCLPS